MKKQNSLKTRDHKRTRAVRSVEELEAAASHVKYEFDMFRVASNYLWTGMCSPADDSTKNLALEAFLLHYRNLRAFLCPSLQPISSDDVIASDFLGSTSAQDIVDPGELKADLTRINKLLAHLSYTRVKYEQAGEKEWKHERMVSSIQVGLRVFFERLPAERHAWFGVLVIPGESDCFV